MSLAAHISSLEKKHAKLDAMVDDESHRPRPDFTVIQTLKKQKLLVKEELERISQPLADSEALSEDSVA